MPRYFLTCRQNSSVRIELFADGTSEFAVGRGYENNMILIRNKLISRRHCQLFKEPDTVRIMADTDVNGIVINDRLLILSGESVVLRNDDEFYVVHSRKRPEQNLSFILGIERTPDDDRVDDTDELVALGIVIPVSGSVNLASLGAALSSATAVTDRQHDEKKESPRSSVTPTNQKPAMSGASSLSNATKAALEPEVQLSSSLQCSICLSILYDPVTLSPCMHNFCSGCCSGWLATNRRCPSCRHKVSLLSKNPSLRAILDGYVATNPSAAKSAEEKTILDAANRLHFGRPFISGSCLPLNEHGDDLIRHGGDDTSEATNPTNESANNSDVNEGSDESDASDEDSPTDSSDDDNESEEGDNANGWPSGSDTEIEENDIPERHEFEHDANSTDAICRQCLPSEGCSLGKASGLKNKLITAAQSLVSSVSGGASSSSAHPGGSAFHCTDPLLHVLCNCCDSPMPDRRIDRSAPPQTCLICSLEYCNLYWSNGCQNGQCTHGCLKYLKDIDLQSLLEEDLTNAPADSSVAILLFGNVYETNQLRSYLQGKGISARQLRDILLNGLESGKYPVKARTLVGRRPDRETPVCSFCRVNVVQDLLFAYRRETHDTATDRRPKCPHGRYCVSQSTDSVHASVVNHICEPTPPGIVIDCTTFQLGNVEQSDGNAQNNKNNRERGSYDHMDLD